MKTIEAIAPLVLVLVVSAAGPRLTTSEHGGTAMAQEPAPPSSAPAAAPTAGAPAIADPAFQEKLFQASQEIAAGNSRKAQAILDPLYAQGKSNPVYFLLLGRMYASAGEEGTAIGAFNHALELRPDLAEALLQLGAACGRTAQYDKAVTSLDAAAKLAPADVQVPYARAMVLVRQDKLDEAEKALRAAAQLSGPAAALAKVRLEQLDTYRQDLARRQEALKALKDNVEQAEAELAKTKETGQSAVAKRETMRGDYDTRRRAAKQDYDNRLADIQRLFDREAPPADLQKTNPGQYNSRMAAADSARTTRQQRVRDEHDRKLLDIDTEFRPKVAAVDGEIKTLEQLVLVRMRLLDPQKRQLADAARAAPPKPRFDPVAELKQIALGLDGREAANPASRQADKP